jgi:hypothetical protein
MSNHVFVWDLETVPDLPCVARVNGLDETDERAAGKSWLRKNGLNRRKVWIAGRSNRKS